MFRVRSHQFVLLALLVASGCAVAPVQWPAELPPVDYFRDYWQADEQNRQLQDEDDYLLWVQRFYLGYNMVPGWLAMTDQVRERLPPSEHAAVTARLNGLGRRIGAEWAKDNAVRKLNTGTAATWRDALLESLSRDDLYAYLDRLDQDVDALLSGTLSREDIRFERYYIDEFDF